MIKIKKGQTAFEDIFYVLGFILFASILIFIAYFIFGKMSPGLSTALTGANPTLSGPTQVNVTKSINQTTSGLGLFNTLYPFLIIGLILMVLISASQMETHPVFFFVSLIVLIVAVIVGVVFSNVYQQITTDAQFGTTSTKFSITNAFMKYLPFIIIILIVIALIVMYSRPQGSKAGGL